MKNGKCPAGEYYCYTNKECKPIPKGFMVGRAGMLRKENGHSVDDTKKNGSGNGNGNGNGGNGNGSGNGGSPSGISEEGLRDWFGKSKSKDGKRGWVNVVTGDSCASDKPGEGIPKCVSSAKRASMSKKERRAAAAAKRRKDPGQQQKTGAAKPTNVKTDRKTRKENVELVDAYGNTFATIHDVIKPEPMKETACPRCGHNPCICRETYDIEAMTESNEWKKMSSQEKSEYMMQRMVNQARGAAAKYDAAKKAAQNVKTTTGSVTVREAKDKKGKGSGSKDACYHKVKSRYSVWPSAYASGALVKCRKVGAANWGNKTKKEEFEFSPSQVMALEAAGLIQLNEKGQKCWKGYEKKGTKKMFGKTYNNCVKKEEVTYEERIRINQNGHTYAVMLNWRGKTYSIQIFFPELRKPTRQEVEDKIRKIYPDAKVTYFAPKEFDPADPTVMVGEQIKIQPRRPGDGFLGPTVNVGGNTLGIPNPLHTPGKSLGDVTRDRVNTIQDTLKKKTEIMKQYGYEPDGYDTIFNRSPALKRYQRNSYQPEGENINEDPGPGYRPTAGSDAGGNKESLGTNKKWDSHMKMWVPNIPKASGKQPQYAHYEPEGEMIGEQGILGALDKAARDTAGNLGSEYAKRQHGNLLGIPGAIGRARGQRTYDQLKDRVLGGGSNNRKNNIGGAGRIQNSYEPEGEVVSERSRLDGPEERKKDLDKRYDPKGGGTNPFQHVPVKKAQKEHVGESRKIKKKFGPKPKPGNPAEYLKNLPAPPTKNLPLPEQLTSEGKSDGDPCWDSHKQVGMKKKGGKMVPNCVPKEEVEVQSEGAAWTKKSGKNQSGGLNEKGRKSYERENPGSDLKRPSKKVGNKRRASFCARMKGMRKRQKPSNNTGEDRLSKSLRAWNC